MNQRIETVHREQASGVPPILIKSEWEVRRKDGKVLRRVRILARHPDGGWIIEDLPSMTRPRPFGMTRIPEFNLRYVFRPVKRVAGQ